MTERNDQSDVEAALSLVMREYSVGRKEAEQIVMRHGFALMAMQTIGEVFVRREDGTEVKIPSSDQTDQDPS